MYEFPTFPELTTGEWLFYVGLSNLIGYACGYFVCWWLRPKQALMDKEDRNRFLHALDQIERVNRKFNEQYGKKGP